METRFATQLSVGNSWNIRFTNLRARIYQLLKTKDSDFFSCSTVCCVLRFVILCCSVSASSTRHAEVPSPYDSSSYFDDALFSNPVLFLSIYDVWLWFACGMNSSCSLSLLTSACLNLALGLTGTRFLIAILFFVVIACGWVSFELSRF